MTDKISTREIQDELEAVLAEIGPIRPQWSDQFDTWVFSHPDYPVEAEGDTEPECIDAYHRYMARFLLERRHGNLSPTVEAQTKGWGGRRPGAGRPPNKTPTVQIRIPADIADWIKRDREQAIHCIRGLMNS